MQRWTEFYKNGWGYWNRSQIKDDAHQPGALFRDPWVTLGPPNRTPKANPAISPTPQRQTPAAAAVPATTTPKRPQGLLSDSAQKNSNEEQGETAARGRSRQKEAKKCWLTNSSPGLFFIILGLVCRKSTETGKNQEVRFCTTSTQGRSDSSRGNGLHKKGIFLF